MNSSYIHILKVNDNSDAFEVPFWFGIFIFCFIIFLVFFIPFIFKYLDKKG